MSNRLSGISSLGYQGTNATMPPNIFYYPRNPTPLDWQNFSIGDIWINKLTEVIYMLVSLQNNVATWQTLTAGASDLIALTGNNTGVSVPPAAGVIHIVGDGTLLNFTGNAGTSTITGAIGGSVLTSIITNSGTVTPVGHTMSLLGGNNISITGSGDTATVSLSQGTDGQVLIGSSSGLPAWRNLTAGSNITITNGPNSIQISATGGGGIPNVASIRLTSAQIKALHATPITIITAPGPGLVIMPLQVIFNMIYGGTNAFTNVGGQVIALFYTNANAASNACSTSGLGTTQITSTSSQVAFNPGSSQTSAATAVNAPVVVSQVSATEIGGNAANDNVIDVTVYYYIITP